MKNKKYFVRFLWKIVLLFFTLSLFSGPSSPLNFKDWLKNQNPALWQYDRISPYVFYKRVFVSEIPISIHILKVLLNQKFMSLELQKASDGVFGRKTLEKIIKGEAEKGEKIIAGVNASFFHENGRPEGLFIDEGLIYTLSNRRSSLIKTVNGKLIISKNMVEIYFDTGKEKVKIDGLNMENPDSKRISLFTSAFNKKIKIEEDLSGISIKLAKKRFSPTEKVKGIIFSIINNGEILLKKGEVLIVLRDSDPILKKIKINSPVNFFIKNLYSKEDIDFAVTGAPQIVRRGFNVYKGSTEGLTSKFVDTLHPRTGIGISKNGKTVFLVVVDGRQPYLSIGMTLDEFAELFMKLGCYNALNLDGGGSSTMWVNGKIVNSPSDAAGPRPISDAILVLDKTYKN